MDDINAGLDVGEGVGGSEDGLAFVLLMQVTVGPTVQRKRCTVHERAQVIVLVKVCDALLQLVSVEERLHICDLKVCLGNINTDGTVQYGDHMYKTAVTVVKQTTYIYIYIKAFSPALAFISNLIGVQFGLVDRVGVLDDRHHVITKSFRVKFLQRKSIYSLKIIILKALSEMHRTTR